MDRSTIKQETLESLATDEIIHDSAGTNLMVSASCCSGTNSEDATELKLKGLMNNSVKLGMNGAIQNGKMENCSNEPSSRIISNLVVIAPQDEDLGRCEQYKTNRRPNSPDHQEDINQYSTIPAVKPKMMDVFIKEEIKEEIDVKQVGWKIENSEEYTKLEGDINCPWVETVKKEEQFVAMKNEMSEDKPQEDVIKSERIDEETSKLSFPEEVCRSNFHPSTALVASSDEGSDNDESCTLSSDEESDRKKKVGGSISTHHQHSDHSYAQSYERSQCNKHVKSESLKNHMLTHSQSNDESFKCPDCDKEFTQLRYLKNHFVIHAHIKPIIFSVCEHGFRSKRGLSNHDSGEALSLMGERPFACETCKKSFTHATIFHNHMMTHHNVELFSCPDCDKVFPQETSLKTHLLKHTSENPHLCTTCDQSFVTQHDLQVHQRTHTEEKLYACTICDKCFRTPIALKDHQRTHTKAKLYACTTCDKCFRAPSALKIHQRIHTGEKPYACTTCNKNFRILSALKNHQRIHTGEKPYACTTCNKNFRTLSALKDHQRTHTSEKPYGCTTCDRSFRTGQSLHYHQRAHTEEKPYVCTTCDKSFRLKSNLKKHQRTHTGEKPYACTTCEKNFTTQYYLQKHQRKHTGDKPYGCITCDKSFITLQHLRQHQRTHTWQEEYSHCASNSSFLQI